MSLNALRRSELSWARTADGELVWPEGIRLGCVRTASLPTQRGRARSDSSSSSRRSLRDQFVAYSSTDTLLARWFVDEDGRWCGPRKNRQPNELCINRCKAPATETHFGSAQLAAQHSPPRRFPRHRNEKRCPDSRAGAAKQTRLTKSGAASVDRPQPTVDRSPPASAFLLPRKRACPLLGKRDRFRRRAGRGSCDRGF